MSIRAIFSATKITKHVSYRTVVTSRRFRWTFSKVPASLYCTNRQTLQRLSTKREKVFPKFFEPVRFFSQKIEQGKIEEPSFSIPELTEAKNFMEKGQFMKAIPLLETSIQICSHSLGQFSYDTLSLYQLLARCYAELNNVERIGPVLEKIINFTETMDEDTDESFLQIVFDAYDNLNLYYLKSNKYDEAINTLDEMKNFSPTNEHFIYTSIQLGIARASNKIVEGTLMLLCECRDMTRERLSTDHWIYGYSLATIGTFYYSQKRYDKAIKYLEESRNFLLKSIDTKLNPNIKARLEIALGDVLCNLGEINLRHKADLRNSEKLLKTSITYLDKYFDRNSYRIAYTIHLIAELELKNSQTFVAEALFRRLTDIYETENRKDFVLVEFKKNYSALLGKLNRRDESERLLEEVRAVEGVEEVGREFMPFDPALKRFLI